MGYYYWTDLIFGCSSEHLPPNILEKLLKLTAVYADYESEEEEQEIRGWWDQATQGRLAEVDVYRAPEPHRFVFGWLLVSRPTDPHYLTPPEYLEAADIFEAIFQAKPQQMLVAREG